MSKKAIILGGGFSGCTIGHLLKQEGWDCTIVEKEDYLGGGCRTFFYGGHPYMNGPRVYYGYSDKIYNWVNQFIELKHLDFELNSYVESEQKFFSYPIHEDDLPRMSKEAQIRKELAARDLEKIQNNFEDYWIENVGKTLYEMFVKDYSEKMWMIDSNKELDTFAWSAKDNPINTGSRIAYKGSHLAYPTAYDGYNSFFYKTTDGLEVILGEAVKNFDLDNKAIILNDGTRLEGDIIVSSIPIEEVCENRLGELPYVGRDFIPFVLPCKEVCPGNLRFLHYTQKEAYTRIVEYKKLTNYDSPDTLLVMELPSKNGKMYPYMINKYLDRAKQYVESLPEDIYTTGRLGTYRYSTIEQTIAQVFDVFVSITGKSIDGMEKEFFQIGDKNIVKDRQSTDSNAVTVAEDVIKKTA